MKQPHRVRLFGVPSAPDGADARPWRSRWASISVAPNVFSVQVSTRRPQSPAYEAPLKASVHITQLDVAADVVMRQTLFTMARPCLLRAAR